MRRRSSILVIVSLSLMIVVHFLLGLFFIAKRDLDRDERFYLTSGNLIAQGKLPCRDCMFSQMPLSPLILGCVRSLGGDSIYHGRYLMLVCMAILHGMIFLTVLRQTEDLKTALALGVMSLTTVMSNDWCTVVKSNAPTILFAGLGWILFLHSLENAAPPRYKYVLFLSSFFLSAANWEKRKYLLSRDHPRIITSSGR
jgi:hypothetical protein